MVLFNKVPTVESATTKFVMSRKNAQNGLYCIFKVINVGAKNPKRSYNLEMNEITEMKATKYPGTRECVERNDWCRRNNSIETETYASRNSFSIFIE